MLLISRFQHCRQLPHSLPCVGAGHILEVAPNQGWSLSITVEAQGQLFTGPWFIICEDIRIIKFDGTSAGETCFRICASRVGSQCLVSGVNLQTSNIFSRCSKLWISPESCHLNQGCLSISTTIACTHCGWSRLSILRCNASLTFLNLYLPFIA